MARRRKLRKSTLRRRRLLFEQLETRWLLATVAWDWGGDGESWNDPRNWQSDTLPGADDEVELLGATVRHSAGDTRIKGVRGFGSTLNVVGGSLTTSGDSSIDKLSVSDASVVVEGQNAILRIFDELTLTGATLAATNGGLIVGIVNSTTYLGPANTIQADGAGIILSNIQGLSATPIEALTVEAINGGGVAFNDTTSLNSAGLIEITADGPNSSVRFPNLSRYDGSPNSELVLDANDGGFVQFRAATLSGTTTINSSANFGTGTSIVDLSGLETLTGLMESHATGNAFVDLSELKTFDSNADRSLLEVADGGGITLGPNLKTLTNVDLKFTRFGSLTTQHLESYRNGRVTTLAMDADFGNVTDVQGSSFTLLGGTVKLDKAANIDGASFDIRETSLALPAATSYSHADTAASLAVSGAGSVLDLRNVTVFDGGTSESDALVISATSGGMVDLSGVTSMTSNRMNMRVAAPNSRIDLSSLETLENGSVEAFDGSVVELPNLSNVLGSTSDFLSGLQAIFAWSGSRIELPRLSQIGVVGAPVRGRVLLQAFDAGSELNAHALETFIAESDAGRIGAFDGGVVHLPADRATRVEGVDVRFGEGGSINASQLLLGAGSKLVGNGTIKSDVVNAARLLPNSPAGGLGPGTLIIDGDYSQTDQGVVNIDLFGSSGSQHDHLTVTGSAELSGVLEVEFHDDFVPAVGDELMDIFTSETRNGNFIRGKGLYAGRGTGVAIEPVWSGGNLTLHAFAVPEFREHLVDDTLSNASSVATGDLNGDGTRDIVATAAQAGQLVWYAHDVRNSTFAKTVIDDTAVQPDNVEVADFNNDGDADLLLTDQSRILWWEQTPDGFTSEHVVNSSYAGFKRAVHANLNEDAYVDIVVAVSLANTVAWWANDGSGNFVEHVLDNSVDGVTGVTAEDLDTDGDIDVIAVGVREVVWWENDGSENFQKHVIDATIDRGQWVHLADLDGDGRLDILVAASGTGELLWYSQVAQREFSRQLLADDFVGAQWVGTGDFDRDGLLDVVATAHVSDEVAWWINRGGGFFVKVILNVESDGASIARVSDLDGDGDLDVVVPSVDAGTIQVWENPTVDRFTVIRMVPPTGGAVAEPPTYIEVEFSSPIDATTWTQDSMKLVASGLDSVVGTNDDVEITAERVEFFDNDRVVRFTPPTSP